MNKLFFIFGFILPLPAFFNDGVAEYLQRLGGSLWPLFSKSVILYPAYLLIFGLPIIIIISLLGVKLKPELDKNKIFLKLFYGFLTSSSLFLLFVLIAISQFKFTQ